jgi:hypothetical protein
VLKLQIVALVAHASLFQCVQASALDLYCGGSELIVGLVVSNYLIE